MINSKDFLATCLEREFQFWTGVPCSHVQSLLQELEENSTCRYIGASSEGEAIAIAAGTSLSGNKSVVLCQNSGLGNMINPLTSLNLVFNIPSLLMITHRGAPQRQDAPQHKVMGPITTPLLDLLDIPWRIIPPEQQVLKELIEEADAYMTEHQRPYALIVQPNSFSNKGNAKHVLAAAKSAQGTIHGAWQCQPNQRMQRIEALKIIKAISGPTWALLGTTGKIGRELFSLGHEDRHFYLLGALGCISALGLGVALGSIEAGKGKGVIVLDGDGSLLMKMGSLATNGSFAPKKFIHIVLDNEVHDSTGGQPTVSARVDFATLAQGCGYHQAYRSDTKETLKSSLEACLQDAGPHLIHLKILPGSAANLGRPDISPPQLAQGFQAWLNSFTA
tara:strand:+ start:65 stop:1237 length:1173 start_codon:yes stop_codon:yes gene_type:complete